MFSQTATLDDDLLAATGYLVCEQRKYNLDPL